MWRLARLAIGNYTGRSTGITLAHPAESRGDFHVGGVRVGIRHAQAFPAQAFEVERRGLLHSFDFSPRFLKRDPSEAWSRWRLG